MNETSDARAKSKSSRTVALLGGAGALALVLGGVTLAMAPSASADGIIVPKNPDCADLVQGSTQIKFDPPTPGEKTADGVTVKWQKRNLLVDDPAHEGSQIGNEVADFQAVGGTVLGAIVKGGNQGANFYDYRPGGSVAGVGLHTPVNEKNQKFQDISHITFCVGKVTTTPPTTPPASTPPASTPPASTPPASTPPTSPPTSPPTDTPPTSPPTDTPPTSPPTDTPPTSPTDTPPTETPTDTPPPSETPPTTPTVSPTSTTSTPGAPVPTDVDAGLSGGLTNTSASTSSQSIWGIALLLFGGVLVFAGVLKSRQTRGQHSA